MAKESSPSIKSDIRSFFIIFNCCLLAAVGLLSLIWLDRTVALTAFVFILLNSLACLLFFLFRINRYQRCEPTPKQPPSDL